MAMWFPPPGPTVPTTGGSALIIKTQVSKVKGMQGQKRSLQNCAALHHLSAQVGFTGSKHSQRAERRSVSDDTRHCVHRTVAIVRRPYVPQVDIQSFQVPVRARVCIGESFNKSRNGHFQLQGPKSGIAAPRGRVLACGCKYCRLR